MHQPTIQDIPFVNKKHKWYISNKSETISENFKVHRFHGSIFRAIFRWICLKDLNKIEIDETVSSESPLGILRGIKQGTESYHDLFKRLCRQACNRSINFRWLRLPKRILINARKDKKKNYEFVRPDVVFDFEHMSQKITRIKQF